MKQEIFINFGGFYKSIHEAQIERRFKNHEAQKRDYTKTQINYSIEYLKKMEQFLFNEKIEVKFRFVRVESPSEHKLFLELIQVNILKKHQKSIINFVKNNFSNELIELIRTQTTPTSNDLLLEACLEIICNEINKDELPHQFELEYLK